MPEPFLSIVIPAYNEAGRIVSSLEAIQDYVRGKDFPVETIVVDDGSTDNTVEIASGQAEIRVLRNERNRGKGFSVRHGVLEAHGELILFTDADLSAPIEEADKLLAAMESSSCRCGGGFAGARARTDRHSPIAVSRMGRPILQPAGPDFHRPQHPRYPVRLQALPAPNHAPRFRTPTRGAIRIRPGNPLPDRAPGGARWWRSRCAGITTLPPKCTISATPCI